MLSGRILSVILVAAAAGGLSWPGLPQAIRDASTAASKPGSQAQAAIAEQLGQADRLALERRTAEARELYLAAAGRARAEGDAALELRALESLGRLLNSDSKFADAKEFLERALAIAESVQDNTAIARIRISLGTNALNRNEARQADASYRAAAEAAEKAGASRLMATALLDVAMLDGTGDGERTEFLDRVIAIARTLGDKALEARAWHSRGDRYFTAGDFASAMEALQTAADLYREAGNQDGLARVYTSLGRMSRAHGRPLDAIASYDKAYDIQQKAGDTIGMVQTLNAMGVAYSAVPNDEKALAYYERAYALALDSTSQRAINFMRGNLAGGLIEIGQYARAADLLETMLRDGGDAYPATRHAQLSSAYLGLGRVDEARSHADLSVQLAQGQPAQLLGALRRRVQVRERLGDLTGALEDLRLAADIVEQMRRKLVPKDFMRQGFTDQFLGVYSGLISIYQRQGEAGRAIEAAEAARARAFLDLLAARQIAPARAALPSDLGQLTESARRTRSTILCYWTTSDAVFIGVVPPSGKVEMKRVDQPARTLASLVRAVAPSAGDEPKRSGSKAGGAKDTVPTDPRAAWRALHRLLIEPVRAALPSPGGRLTIVPHGPLMRLPFAALVGPDGRYLVEDYSIAYVPAGALLDFTSGRVSAKRNRQQYLLVADPTLAPPRKGESPLPPLPGARDEVRAIARLVPAGAAIVLEGPRADEQAVLAAMRDPSVLHFATHGVANDQAPLDSYLALGRPAAGGDGRLTAQEIYGLTLNADLVVLSACRSAGGTPTGEGIAALARAFFYAGASSIVASVWDVPDQPANRLFAPLYAAWLRDGSPADALRAAQLKLIADLRAGRVRVRTAAGEVVLPESPILWAGFVVLGEP